MPEHIRIRVKPAPKEQILSLDDILASRTFSDDVRCRLRSYMCHEQRERADYHKRPYLRHLTEDELHLRIDYLIANVVYVSARNRYSSNNLYANYWRARLAHTAEALVLSGSTRHVPLKVLQHLPPLGLMTPRTPALTNDQGTHTLYRYDKLRYLKALRSRGEIYLRCASTEDITTDAARYDANELCLRLRLLAEDLDVTSTSPELAMRGWTETINFQIHQKTDFYMFCLSQVYDWRLFGDFNSSPPSSAADDKIACLVINDPGKFLRRFAAAAATFTTQHSEQFSHPLRTHARRAVYYDQCDARECAPLFAPGLTLPFAKRREFNYQHEFRLVIRPDIPEDTFPTCSPENLPRFARKFLNIGSLEDIATIVELDSPAPATFPFYLSIKNVVLLSSAIGVTMPNAGEMVRFVYSVENKEKGRTDPRNLTSAKRSSGGSMSMHAKHIDVSADGSQSCMLHAIRDFYGTFDVREHGNHLTSFQACDPLRGWKCTYSAFLPCSEPADDKIEVQTIEFEFYYVWRHRDGIVLKNTERIEIDGSTYMAQYNGAGPLHLHVTYRSLLVAEMMFIQSLIEKGVDNLITFEATNPDTRYRCSKFEMTESGSLTPAPATS